MASMAGYTKLFNSILGSSVWRTNVETKVLWITLLAMADKDGIAEASVGGLADFARLSMEQTRKALKELSSPDEDSRTKEFEGRRIEACEGGWRLLNHAKYRAKMSVDERREYKRLKQREYRERDRGLDEDNQSTGGPGGHIAEAKADTKAEAYGSNPPISPRERTNERTATDSSTPNGPTDAEIDSVDEELRFEEGRLLALCGQIRESGDDVQAVIDSLPRSPTRSPFNASRMLRMGLSGVPRTQAGLTVLRLLCDALEARQRAQAVPYVSDNNKRTFDAADRVLARMVAKRDGTPLPKEIEG